MFVNIHVHPLLILFIFISLITGTFISLFIVLVIVLWHELGHYAAAMYYKWRVDSIMLWVFGGVMKTDESYYRPIKEEAIVTVAGPLQHLVIFLTLFLISKAALLPESIIEQAYQYNWMILLFNLLPISPLDGGKLLLLFQSSILPYYIAFRRTILLSISICIGILFMQYIWLPFTWSAFALGCFLLLENYRTWKEQYYVFIRFLLFRSEHVKRHRQETIYETEDALLMDIFKQWKRNYVHQICIKRKVAASVVVDERFCLDAYFNNQHIAAPIGEIIDAEQKSGC